MRVLTLTLAAAALALAAPSAEAQRVLFDARHGQTAGNADWIVDADSSLQEWLDFRCLSRSFHHSGQRFPTPPQATIGAATPETVWSGGISAWAVDLAKDALRPERGRDWTIEQYPWDAPEFTFGDATNPQDLANYDVLILCEPNVLFTEAETQAIREFVAAGGGLFLCADHETSDRNCSGGGGEPHDSPFILNRLMQTDVETQTAPPYFDPATPHNDFGVFGIWFYENGNDEEDDPGNRAFDWFNEATNRNVADDLADPILHGPFGDGTGGLGLFGSTQIAISTHPEHGNPTARAHVWRNGAPREANAQGVATRVTFASARFGAGRVVAVGDSSPADDGTGEGGLHPGWDRAGGGVANDVIFLNATAWLANPAPDATAPTITGGPAAAAADCSAVVTWITDEPASSEIAWGEAPALDRAAGTPGFAIGHEVTLTGLRPETGYRFQVASRDPAGNGPTESAAEEFVTTAATAVGLEAAAVEAVTPAAVTVSWRTAKPATGSVRAVAAGSERTAAASEPKLGQTVRVAGLRPETAYQLTVEAVDACGAAATATLSATTPAAPATLDLAGWRLVNDNPQFDFTFPAGTVITAGGFLVVGRANDRAGFEAAWGPLDPAVAYLDSGDELIVNATPRPYTLLDATGQPIDGPTATIAKDASKTRRDACLDAGLATAWETRDDGEADPGRGAPLACGAGVVITEMSDAGDFRNEFVELWFDAGSSP
jgi:chitodextrinase